MYLFFSAKSHIHKPSLLYKASKPTKTKSVVIKIGVKVNCIFIKYNFIKYNIFINCIFIKIVFL